MRICIPAIKNWTRIWMHRLLLKFHNLLNRLIMLLAILIMEKEKGEGKGKEVEVVVLTEVAIMIIMGAVDSMMQARGPLDMAKGARTMVITGARVIITKEIRTLISHPINPLKLFTRISSNGSSNKDPVSSFKGIRLGAIVGTVVVAIMVGVLEVAATGAWVCLITSMARATGRPSVPHNWSVRSAVDPT